MATNQGVMEGELDITGMRGEGEARKRMGGNNAWRAVNSDGAWRGISGIVGGGLRVMTYNYASALTARNTNIKCGWCAIPPWVAVAFMTWYNRFIRQIRPAYLPPDACEKRFARWYLLHYFKPAPSTALEARFK